MSRIAQSPDEFMELLRARHATLMALPPEKFPGQFKTSSNQASNMIFVHPDLVVGTMTDRSHGESRRWILRGSDR